MFKQREEQRFMIQQDSEGQALWGSPEPQPKEPMTTRFKRRRSKKVWRKVESSSSSTSPRQDNQWQVKQEKGPARQTQNDEPLPKVNRYLSHI